MRFMCFFHVFIWYQRPMMTAGRWHDNANEERPITRPHAQRFDGVAVLMTNFVYGICYRKHTANIRHTWTIKQADNMQYLHLLSFLILSTTVRRLTNGEAAGNKVGAAQSFPPSVWITINLMYQCLKVELRHDSRMINGSVYCLI